MKRYIFIAKGIEPVIAVALDRCAFRQYVRRTLGFPSWRDLPRHCIATIS